MNCYVVQADNAPGARCIPNAPVRSGGAASTLCGWVDVSYGEEEGEPTCEDCLAIVRYCKRLPIGGAHEPRQRDRRATGRGTPRPFKLLWADANWAGLQAEHWAAYTTAENARKARDRRIAHLAEQHHAWMYNGWWVIEGPNGFREEVGHGAKAGESMPDWTRTS